MRPLWWGFAFVSVRNYVYDLLENHQTIVKNDTTQALLKYANIIDWLLIVLIVANALAVILESVDSIYYRHHFYFVVFECVSVAVFVAEYLARFWSIAEQNPSKAWRIRLRWATGFGAMIDLLAIVPAILPSLIGVDLRFLRVLRLVRLLKLTRYFESLRILLVVIDQQKSSFAAVVFILSLLIVLSSSLIYLAEYESQPQAFNSIPHAMWWAVVTLTTVGYGDVTPMTPWGKFLGALITILGVGLAALPAGILATGLSRELAHQHTKRLDELYERYLALELSDLYNTAQMDKMADALGIDRQHREQVLGQVVREKRLLAKEQELAQKEQALSQHRFCPYCGRGVHFGDKK